MFLQLISQKISFWSFKIIITRGIWKVLSMVFYLSKRFTKPIMFGIILKNYLSSMIWHRFYEDMIMQTRKIYCEYMYCLYTEKRKISVENITFYLLKSVQNINNISWNKIILCHLIGHNLVQLLHNWWSSWMFLIIKYRNNNTKIV